jgi:hypothetical protein
VELVSFPQQVQINVPDAQETNLMEVQAMILVVADIATSPFFNNSNKFENILNKYNYSKSEEF